jgi:hypothetical protein
VYTEHASRVQDGNSVKGYQIPNKPMPIDLRNVLKDLYTERKRLEHVITALETLQHGSAAGLPPQKKTNRGRKSMGAEERRQVSGRMRKYWAARHKQKTQAVS